MNRVILFSPVGGTDPISLSNCHDGSLLHICRNYRPDKVILYMSKEMLDYQEADDRYMYCLTRLDRMQNRNTEYAVIERRELTRVHEFDYFYQDFRGIIREIYDELDDTDTLLINISSGTPAMKSGLLVLQTLGEFPARLIQVATPENGISEHIHKDYDVETLWELDEDNRDGAANRCREVKCPTLSKIKKEEIIKKHISVYDYQAALDAADSLSTEENSRYRDLIYLASRRLLLDFSGVDKIIQRTGFNCLPVRTSSERKYFEYALNIDIRLRKKEYVDFVRSITPLVVDLFELILRKQCGIDINRYCDSYKNNGAVARKWSTAKLAGSSVLNALNQCFVSNGQQFSGKDIYSIHLKALIDGFSQDEQLKRLVENVRSVEGSIRNLAAHEIVSVTEESIKRITGFSPKDIMDMIKELFNYTGMSIKGNYWDSYDDMNKVILEKLSLD